MRWPWKAAARYVKTRPDFEEREEELRVDEFKYSIAYMLPPIIVTGIPCSGRGLVAHILAEHGVFGIDEDRTRQRKWNAPGVETMTGLNGAILHQVIRPQFVWLTGDGYARDHLPTREQRHHRVTDMYASMIATKIKRIIFSQGYRPRPECSWMITCGKIPLLWPAYKAAFPGAHWIVVTRDPDDNLEALQRCYPMTGMFRRLSEAKILLWMRQYQECITEMLSEDSGLDLRSVDFANLVAGDSRELRAAFANCGLQLDRKIAREVLVHDRENDYGQTDRRSF